MSVAHTWLGRLHAHLLHQLGNMQAADPDAFGSKQIAQRPAASERKIHV